jgi:hypothetical protein
VGYRKLTQHRKKLEMGDVPEGTKLSEGIMAFRFDFNDNRGKRHVELVDYAGELVSASPETLATRLREHMKSCDGLLVLAETPAPDRDLAPLARELVRLQSAFAVVLDEKSAEPRVPWPVAVLFNKWDRRGDSVPPPGSAERIVGEFLQQTPSPPHASLVDAIRNAVGDDNVRCFPVSAFGGHVLREDGKEVPKLVNGVMQSFGLEDGFLWAIHRAEELEVERLAAAERQTSWLAFWQLLGESPRGFNAVTSWQQRVWGISPAKGAVAGWQAAAKFTEGDFLKGRSRHITGRFLLKTVTQAVTFLAVLVGAGMTVETIRDGMMYHRVAALGRDGNASDADLDAAETWLESYYTAPTLRHFASRFVVLGRASSLTTRDDLQGVRETRSWKRVTDATEELDQAAAAEGYLKRFPSGPHVAEAEEIALAWRRRVEEQENLSFLSDLESRHAAIVGNDSAALQECDALYSETGRLPRPEVLTAAVTQRQESMQASISRSKERIRNTIDGVNWAEFTREYDSLMTDGKAADAAVVLQRRRASDPRAEELVKDFATRAPAAIRASVQKAIRDYAWDDARRDAATVNEVAVAKLLPAEQTAKLQDLDELIDAAEDEHLYSLILRNKPACQDQINAYMTRAQLKTMQSNVEAYRQYLAKIAGPLDVTLVLSEIRWGGKYYSSVGYAYNNDISVKCRGIEEISTPNVRSHANSASKDLGEAVVKGHLRDVVTLDVAITCKYGRVTTSRMDGGKGSWTGTIDELRRGASIDAKGDGFVNHCTFSVHGLPNEPALPPWHR